MTTSSPAPPLVDLHTHTTASDGLLSPQELIHAAQKAKLAIMAITDHDCTEAIEPALEATRGTALRIIPGIEVSCYCGAIEVHLLGYFIDYRSSVLQAHLAELRRERIERVYAICALLKKEGVALEPTEVFALAKGKTVGRAHIARALVQKGAVPSIHQAFQRYLNPHRPAYVEANKLTSREATELIRSVDGVPVVAHPGLLEDDSVIETLVREGVMGIEVFHHYNSPSKYQRYLKVARQYELLVTGGSDYHGPERETSPELGEITLPYEYFSELDKKRPS